MRELVHRMAERINAEPQPRAANSLDGDVSADGVTLLGRTRVSVAGRSADHASIDHLSGHLEGRSAGRPTGRPTGRGGRGRTEALASAGDQAVRRPDAPTIAAIEAIRTSIGSRRSANGFSTLTSRLGRPASDHLNFDNVEHRAIQRDRPGENRFRRKWSTPVRSESVRRGMRISIGMEKALIGTIDPGRRGRRRR